MDLTRVRPRWWLYACVAIIQVTTLALGLDVISVPAQALLMPTLALVARRVLTGRGRRWALIALFFSFCGDLVPRFVPVEHELLVLIGAFALAQVAWMIALRPGLNVTARRAAMIAGPPAAFLALILKPAAGELAPAVIIYAALLVTMTIHAACWGWRGALGGALFLLSDSLIAVTAFHPDLESRAASVIIMATYVSAQGFLVDAMSSGQVGSHP